MHAPPGVRCLERFAHRRGRCGCWRTVPSSVRRAPTFNPPGSETGPGGVATWGVATENRAEAFGLSFERAERSSKHIPFDWSGPG